MLLYFRTTINIIIGLYTSRMILAALGVTDYGIYSVVAGVVALSSFFTSSMSSATTRQITYALGKNNSEQLQKIFSCCSGIHYGIAIFVLLLSETIGIWFLNTQMAFPENRIFAANWVYQFAIITTILSIVITPSNAAITAHEDFNIPAYLGIAQTIANLIAVFILYLLPKHTDYLIAYSGFCMLIQMGYNFAINLFAKKKYKLSVQLSICKKSDYKSIISFSGWTVFGSCANIGYQQGVNILFNILLDLSVNAAMGIANQINSKINTLVINFQQAFNPQITKSYAIGDLNNLHNLIFKSAKFSFIILFIFALPIILNIDFILSIWLGNYPPYTASLSILILIGSLIETLSGPLWITLYATGKIKMYQISISLILLSSLPITYILIQMGYDANAAIGARIILFILGIILRLYFLKRYIGLSIQAFTIKVLQPIAYIIAISSTLIFIKVNLSTFPHLLLIGGECILISIISFIVGFTAKERNTILKAITNKFYKKQKKGKYDIM